MATATKFVFNSHPLQLGKITFSQPQEDDFPELQFKYADFGHVYKNTTDYVRQVLDSCQLQHNHKWAVVDVKVTQIFPGKAPCLPGWHCDTLIDPYDVRREEIHHLYVTGGASLTEFISSPVELEVDSELQHQKLLHSFRKQLETLEYGVVKVPSCRVVTYGRFDFHRGSLGLFSEKRLLIRVTETDVVAPRNQPF